MASVIMRGGRGNATEETAISLCIVAAERLGPAGSEEQADARSDLALFLARRMRARGPDARETLTLGFESWKLPVRAWFPQKGGDA